MSRVANPSSSSCCVNRVSSLWKSCADLAGQARTKPWLPYPIPVLSALPWQLYPTGLTVLQQPARCCLLFCPSKAQLPWKWRLHADTINADAELENHVLASGPFCRLRCASHVHHAYFPKDCRSHSRGSKNEHGCFDAGRVFVGRMLRGWGRLFRLHFLIRMCAYGPRKSVTRFPWHDQYHVCPYGSRRASMKRVFVSLRVFIFIM